MHTKPHPLAGKTVRIKAHVTHPQNDKFGGAELRIEDWHDRIAGQSWMDCNGNPACIIYAMRTGLATHDVPTDNEVVYGKVGPFGHLVHVSELEIPESALPNIERK